MVPRLFNHHGVIHFCLFRIRSSRLSDPGIIYLAHTEASRKIYVLAIEPLCLYCIDKFQGCPSYLCTKIMSAIALLFLSPIEIFPLFTSAIYRMFESKYKIPIGQQHCLDAIH